MAITKKLLAEGVVLILPLVVAVLHKRFQGNGFHPEKRAYQPKGLRQGDALSGGLQRQTGQRVRRGREIERYPVSFLILKK